MSNVEIYLKLIQGQIKAENSGDKESFEHINNFLKNIYNKKNREAIKIFVNNGEVFEKYNLEEVCSQIICNSMDHKGAMPNFIEDYI